jgi:acyl phosphate:glycerol-3-phosphate acyltransferase
MTYIIVAVFLAYLMGSIPTGYIFGKVLKKIDIREHGSGNVGATNVFRVVGKVPGFIVLILDFLKGLLAVVFIPVLMNEVFGTLDCSTVNAIIAIGMAAVAGHIWTIFLKFKGGKGVATSAGIMVGIAPMIMLSALIVWIAIFAIWKYVSLSSISAATTLPIFAVAYGKNLSLIIFCSIICLVGLFSHRTNIKRLIQGEEKRII